MIALTYEDVRFLDTTLNDVVEVGHDALKFLVEAHHYEEAESDIKRAKRLRDILNAAMERPYT